MTHWSWYAILGLCFGISVFLGLLECLVINPWLRKKILEEHTTALFSDGNEKESVVTIKYEKYTEEDNIEENPVNGL